MYITKDSGEREVMDTGSQRDTQVGKGLPSLIPTVAMRRLAGLYERGAVKYDRHNWRKGQPMSRYVDSLYRHLWNIMDDVRDGEDHYAALLWNAIGLLWTDEAIGAENLPAELFDLIGPTEVPGTTETNDFIPCTVCGKQSNGAVNTMYGKGLYMEARCLPHHNDLRSASTIRRSVEQ